MARTRTDGKTDQRARTSAANGRKGGAKKVAMDRALVDQLGPPPIDKPLQLARWWQSLLALDTYERIQGSGTDTMSTTIRSAASVAAKLVPQDVMYEAQRLLHQHDAELGDDEAGPGEEDLDKEPNEPSRPGAIRCSPARG